MRRYIRGFLILIIVLALISWALTYWFTKQLESQGKMRYGQAVTGLTGSEMLSITRTLESWYDTCLQARIHKHKASAQAAGADIANMTHLETLLLKETERAGTFVRADSNVSVRHPVLRLETLEDVRWAVVHSRLNYQFLEYARLGEQGVRDELVALREDADTPYGWRVEQVLHCGAIFPADNTCTQMYRRFATGKVPMEVLLQEQAMLRSCY